jgi:polysaccharide deacetylase family protein (PEP-CTERM system associated)
MNGSRACPSKTVNALTVDLEEWFHVCGVAWEPPANPADWRVRLNTEKLLSLFADYGVKATFFVLGCVAEALPELVGRIAAEGHEIASHGYSHRMITGLDPIGFRDELRNTCEILERLSGQRPIGFRAPQWSLSAATPWAFEILHEEGYLYDSSCNPLPFVGNPAGSRMPHRVKVRQGSIWEIPPMVTPSPFCNLPTGGGWGLRVFPRCMIRKSIREMNNSGAPAVLFLHPRELDPSGPRLRLTPLKKFASYGPRTDLSARLSELLRDFRFGTLKDMVEQWESA